MNDEYFMQTTIDIAKENETCEAAMVLKDNYEVSRASVPHNSQIKASVVAIAKALEAMNGTTLEECAIYSVEEPDAKTMDVINETHIGKVVYGAEGEDLIALGKEFEEGRPTNQDLIVNKGVLKNRCLSLIKEF